MALNKRGKTEIGTVFMWIAIALVIAYVANFNGFQGTVNNMFMAAPSAPINGVPLSSGQCPTDGTSTYTLNVQDALTSTATDVSASYYIFNGNKLIKEGTTGSDGTVSVDVACGKDYELLLLNATTDTGYYSKVIDLNARISEDTINAGLIGFGQAKILGVENPAANSDSWEQWNVNLPANTVKQFNIKFVSNRTEDGFNKPVIMCQANISAISSVTLSTFSDGTPVTVVSTLPKRITATSGYQYYAWEYGKMLTPTSGVVTASGSITSLSSATPSTTDYMTCILVDQATWATSGYKTSTSVADGFKTGPENTETLGDVGGIDFNTAATANLTYGGNY